MPIGTIIAIVIAYVAIAVLLLSLNLVSRWKWWVKAGAIVVCGFFFVGSYFAITSLLGWPTEASVPERFSLVATRVVEPDKLTGAPGAIYLWLEIVDENNIPSGLPLSYRLAYSDELGVAVHTAQEVLDAGEDVEGTIREDEGQQEHAGGELAGVDAPQAGSRSIDETETQLNLMFNDMPPVRLPSKGVL